MTSLTRVPTGVKRGWCPHAIQAASRHALLCGIHARRFRSSRSEFPAAAGQRKDLRSIGGPRRSRKWKVHLMGAQAPRVLILISETEKQRSKSRAEGGLQARRRVLSSGIRHHAVKQMDAKVSEERVGGGRIFSGDVTAHGVTFHRQRSFRVL
jgi:hypothetical protein